MESKDWVEGLALVRKRIIYGPCSWPRVLGILVFILSTFRSHRISGMASLALCFESNILTVILATDYVDIRKLSIKVLQ